MRKILLSLLTIGLVSGSALGLTRAYFTDTETNTGNTFSTGTIDISVDNSNPWSRTNPYTLSDMKPSQVDYITFTVKNTGTNPANIFKKLTNVVTGQGVQSEEENAYERANGVRNDIDTVIDYDMNVELFDAQGTPAWHQMVYDKNVTISGIKDKDMFLGMVPVGWSMKVTQSYHMKPDTANWAQGDTMGFDIGLTAEQLKGTALLYKKSGDPKWLIDFTGPMGTLTYGVKDKTFKYSFNATGLVAGTAYSLIHYVDPWPGNGTGSVGLIGSGTSDEAGVLSFSGDQEFGANLINAKIWLVPSGNYNPATKSLIGWNPTTYLFETGLIDYYDSDL